MEENTLISIIVPCYNQAKYLDECLQSVLDQTYQNWECIIINDGSPDHTEQVAKKWTATDSRFKYIFQNNSGVSVARNHGIEKALGKWILPLDGDDKIHHNYLELAEKEFVNNYTIIYCNAEFIGSLTGKWDLPEFKIEEFLLSNSIFCTAFFKKEDWILVNGYDEEMQEGHEDYDFWVSILSNKLSVFKINDVLFYYRIKEESRTTHLDYGKRLKLDEYMLLKHKNFYKEIYKNYYHFIEKNINLKKKNLQLGSELAKIKSSKLYFLYKIFYTLFPKL